MSSKKKAGDYFSRFTAMAEFSTQAAEKLQAILDDFSPHHMTVWMEEMHEIEHSADNTKHEIIRLLDKDFLPPFERDDIIRLANELDNVTDAIEDVLQRLYMYNVKSIRPESQDMAEVLLKSCRLLKQTLEEFPNYKRSDCLHDQIVEINRLEEVGDRMYVDATHSLFVGGEDALVTLAWTEVFRCLEVCFDSCEHAANVVENIVMKNA
ncbi:MAG TPA: DUF47 family protein [Clostridiales bacterium]|jgi:predicted phosphate transport protein (TIGR00153 family)|nr:DUF47 family protein [Clostridiales bacterium]